MIPLLLIFIAAISYFLGTMNGAIILSRYVFHKDIRKYGSGNAGYTNFARVFGWKWAAGVIGIDVLKSVVAVLLGGLLMRIPGDGFPVIGRIFAAFCLVIGHMWPVQYKFRGGKGVVCLLTALWVTDFRIGLTATAVFAVVLALSQYVSLASLSACFAGAISTWIFVESEQLKGVAGLVVFITFLLVLWRHRGNVVRLLEHREPKVRWGRRPESKLRDDRF